MLSRERECEPLAQKKMLIVIITHFGGFSALDQALLIADITVVFVDWKNEQGGPVPVERQVRCPKCSERERHL